MFDPEPKPVRVALYGRVSTEEQREGQTIDAQIAEIEKFTKEKGWIVANVYKDEGWSGSLLVRPELDRLRDDATRGVFDAVLVNDVDRLARDVSHLGILKRDFERKQIRLIFRKLPAETSPTYNLMVNILGSFAEFERELIIDRTRRGRRHKVEVRKQYVGCVAPYGYRYEKGSASDGKEAVVTIVPEEARIVRDMYGWVLDGVSIDNVAKRLTTLGIPTQKGKPEWRGCTVYRILRNETYAGVWAYGKSESCEPKTRRKHIAYRRNVKTGRRPRPRTEWLRINMARRLTIIERSLWTKVQERISRNRGFSPRNTKYSYLLQGLLRCGYCGHAFAGTYCRQREKVYLYYYCWTRSCKKGRWVPVGILDSIVWKTLQEGLSSPRLLSRRIATARAEIDADKARTRSEKTVSVEQLHRDREAALFARYRLGNLSPNQLAAELQALAARFKESKSVEVAPQAWLGASFEEVCRQVMVRLENPTPSLRRDILRNLVEEITVEIDRVRIRAKLPMESDGEAIGSTPAPSVQDGAESRGVNSETALPPLRERRGNTRMEVELIAALPAPRHTASDALQAKYRHATSKKDRGITLL